MSDSRSRALRFVTMLLPFGNTREGGGAKADAARKSKPMPSTINSAPPSAAPRPNRGGASAVHVRPVEIKPSAPKARLTAQDRYAEMTKAMLAEHRVTVRKWRSSMSGVAWEQPSGKTKIRCIEAPMPKGPMSAAVFLHEVGHHALGVGSIRPRCMEEYHAWMFSLKQMERWNIRITDRVEQRVHDSLLYAVAKAKRRGIKDIPAPLVAYLKLRKM